MNPLRLRVDADQREIAIDRDTTIGRDDKCDLVLDDLLASREHCVVSQRDDGWWIDDLISASGTFVNNTKVSAQTPLHPGDQIRVGTSVLTVL